jgi:hypothetical protein
MRVEELNEQGYVRLGRVASGDELLRLRSRADALMLGEVRHEGLFFQLDAPTGRYEDAPIGRGWEGPSLSYRKLEKLERDPIFFAWLSNPVFEAAVRVCPGGGGGGIALYRAMVMNKPAHTGSDLPWHQDGGRLWGLDRDPIVQIWTALDDATIASGCVHVVPGTHKAGLVSDLGGLLPAREAEIADARAVPLEVEAGEAIMLHCHLWHSSPANRTHSPRRAFSACYISTGTRCTRKHKTPRHFPVVWRG